MKQRQSKVIAIIIAVFMVFTVTAIPFPASAAESQRETASVPDIKNAGSLSFDEWEIVYNILGTCPSMDNVEFAEGKNVSPSFTLIYLYLNNDFEPYDNYEENGYGYEITFKELIRLIDKSFVSYDKKNVRKWMDAFIAEGAEYDVSKYDKDTDTYYFSFGLGGWFDHVLTSVEKVGTSYILKGKYYEEGKYVQDMQFLIIKTSEGYKVAAYGKRVLAKTTGLKSISAGTNHIKLSWNKQSGVDGYKVYRLIDSKYKLVKTIKGASNNSCTVKDLKAGTGCKFKVRAYAGTKPYYGAYSNVLSAPTKPARVEMTKLTTGSSHYVKAFWKQKRGSGYQVKIATDPKFTKGEKVYNVKSYKTTSKKITKLKKGRTYYVKVRAYKSYGGKTKYGQWSKYKKIKCK